MLPQGRGSAVVLDRRGRHPDGVAQQVDLARDRMVDRGPQATMTHLRVGEDALQVVHRADGHIGGLELGEPLCCGPGAERLA